MNEINQTHSGDSINNGTPFVGTKYSTFKKSLNYLLLSTQRFGEIQPHFVLDCVPGDKVRLRSSHKIETLSLKSPLMQNINVHKNYFSVSLQAILPRNWEKAYKNPIQGDDVPSDVLPVIAGNSPSLLMGYYLEKIQSLFDVEEGQEVDSESLLYFIFVFLNLGNYFYSKGSLLKTLGCSLSSFILSDDSSEKYDWDSFVQYCYNIIKEHISWFSIEGSVVIINSNIDYSDFDSDQKFISFHDFLSILHDNADFTLNHVDWYQSSSEDFFVSSFDSVFNDFDFSFAFGLKTQPINLSRLIAYQLVCAHFFTNDHVDYLYTADLFRDNFLSIFYDAGIYDILESFSYNGVYTLYDVFSGHTLEKLFEEVNGYLLPLFSLIFGFRRSLRYVDYFTGSRTRPLAIGDTSVDASSGYVSVVDVTRNIQLQRFLNSINLAGSRISNYVKDLFGVSMDVDYHNPLYLGSTNDVAFASDVQNTGDSQLSSAQSRTSLVKSNASRFAFEFSCDRPSIVIGVTWFDIPRCYGQYTSRHFYHKDRFDMFVPDLQYIGDQPVYTDELTPDPNSNIFGYQGRYMEFKQNVDYACGGFLGYLPAFAFIADRVNGLTRGRFDEESLSPSYIRSLPSELDEFFISLTGDTLASYFHFIMMNNNEVWCRRPMVVNPQILK